MTMPAANLRPENLMGPNQPKALFQASVLYTPPELGYYWGWIGYYEPDRIPRMLKQVGEETAKMALRAFEVAITAMGVHEPGPEMRLAIYRLKPIELWMEQKAKFPWRYEHDMLDWEKLKAQYGPEPEPTLPEVIP